MECHKCEHRASVVSGKFSGLVFEETPCARCDGTAYEYPMQYRDLLPSDETLSSESSVPEQAFPEKETTPLLPVSVLVATVETLLSLPDLELRILRLRRRGLTHDGIACALGARKRAVECRFNRILARHPVLASLFPSRRSFTGCGAGVSNADAMPK